MVKHALFYDEPEAISVKVDTAGGPDDGIDGNDVGFSAGGSIAELAKKQKKDKTVKWMCILFFSTLLLLIFQLLLGWLGRAVSLLADSGHSAADVISYGLNLWIEWMKFKPGLHTSKSEVTSKKVASNAKNLDMVGSLASLAILLFATSFSLMEAVTRLQVPSQKESGNIGRALLAYSVVSTAVSLGLFFLFRRWHGKGKRGGSRAATIGKENPQDDPLGLDKLEWCPPCTNQTISKADIDEIVDEAADASGGSTAASNAEEAALALHMIIHPGCTCSADMINWGSSNLEVEIGTSSDVPVNEKTGKQEFVAVSFVMSKNLNLIAAFLHLITDTLRSVIILCVALLIQLKAIQDAEYGDAMCGLVIACLIYVGSMALLLQVFARIYACIKRKRAAAQSEPTRSNEKSVP